MINYIDGDLIKLAKEGKFDVIAHGCNCLSTMGSGIAPQMARAFDCDIFDLERIGPDINKLGCIDSNIWSLEHGYDKRNEPELTVVNAYTQYSYGKNHKDGVSSPVDYEAITLCMRKMNLIFKGKHLGLPRIGAGLAGGNWDIIEKIINDECGDMKITVVNYVL